MKITSKWTFLTIYENIFFVRIFLIYVVVIIFTLPNLGSAETISYSDERLIVEADLAMFSKKKLRIARNEIFARHGYSFKSQDLAKHFSQYDWYNPKTKSVELSNIESANVAFIKKYEKSEQLFGKLQRLQPKIDGAKPQKNLNNNSSNTSLSHSSKSKDLKNSKKLVQNIRLKQFSCSKNGQPNDVVKDAVGFIIGGENGWKTNHIVDYSIDNCSVCVIGQAPSLKILGLHRIKRQFNFSKAKWKSGKFKVVKGQDFLMVSGEKGVFKREAIDEKGEDVSSVMPLLLGISSGESSVIEIPNLLGVGGRDRMTKAVTDLRRQCPGIKSKY